MHQLLLFFESGTWKIRYKNFLPFSSYFGIMPQCLFIITERKDHLFLHMRRKASSLLHNLLYRVSYFLVSRASKTTNGWVATNELPQGSVYGLVNHSWNHTSIQIASTGHKWPLKKPYVHWDQKVTNPLTLLFYCSTDCQYCTNFSGCYLNVNDSTPVFTCLNDYVRLTQSFKHKSCGTMGSQDDTHNLSLQQPQAKWVQGTGFQ